MRPGRIRLGRKRRLLAAIAVLAVMLFTVAGALAHDSASQRLNVHDYPNQRNEGAGAGDAQGENGSGGSGNLGGRGQGSGISQPPSVSPGPSGSPRTGVSWPTSPSQTTTVSQTTSATQSTSVSQTTSSTASESESSNSSSVSESQSSVSQPVTPGQTDNSQSGNGRHHGDGSRGGDGRRQGNGGEQSEGGQPGNITSSATSSAQTLTIRTPGITALSSATGTQRVEPMAIGSPPAAVSSPSSVPSSASPLPAGIVSLPVSVLTTPAAPTPAPTPVAVPAPTPVLLPTRANSSFPTLAASPLEQNKSTIFSNAAGQGVSPAPGALSPAGQLAIGTSPGGAFATAGSIVSPSALASLLTPAVASTSGTTGAHARPSRSTGHRRHPATVTKPTVIQRLERVIPGFVWIALAAAIGLAAIGGAAAFRSSRRARRQAGQFAAVSAAALTDPLTGVLNRRGFTDAVERELARARRYGRPFVLAYVDVRGLKQVNDTEGHLAGDRLLKEVALIMTESARADDVVGRLGGDELGLLLAEQSSGGAAAVTHRIQTEVPARRAVMDISAPWDLTIGIAAFPEDGDSFDELLHAADRRLYEQRGIALASEASQPPANAPFS